MAAVRTMVGALTALGLGACNLAGAPPPVDPAQVVLQPGDIAGLQRCAGSGPIDGWLTHLSGPGRAAHDELSTTWSDLRHQGADEAAIAVYTAQPATCAARMGTGPGASASSLVVRFRDENAAVAVYRSGLLGFATPGEDQQVQGMSRGAATGIGRNAWTMQEVVSGRQLTVGLWARNATVVLFVTADVDPLHAKQALNAVDGRIP
jgi:hypothetical protein